MSERIYLIIAGLALLIILYLDMDNLIYGYIGILFFEGITNWRIPKVVSKIRYRNACLIPQYINQNYKINIEAEQALRLILASMLIISYIAIPNQAWFLPWFLGVMLTFAGISRFCPMVMTLKWIGLK
ncbi:MAG: DUF2892 domain-containing protein [Gammaproteobacteria bacterium]|nr:DUF2892 domain-containing protein [Gammaproteobacteria bacterium]MDH5736489.1 DUF2892 domain-containing protein [Gammaproteobacteria bacterium]